MFQNLTEAMKELQALQPFIQDERFNTSIRHPKMQKFLRDPEPLMFVSRINPQDFLQT